MKIKRIIAFVFASAIVLVLGYFYVSFNGNPISSFLATRNAKEYIEEMYPNTDYQTEKAYYNFKFSEYVVRVKSEKNMDEHFSLSYNWTGKLERDSYEDEVKSKWNVLMRLEDEYRVLVDRGLEASDFPIDFTNEKNFGYGTFISDKTNAILQSELELNKDYDIKELGKESGYLVLYVFQDEVSISDIAQSLRNIKTYMDQHEIPFKLITLQFMLENESKGVQYFKYEDIESENVEELIKENGLNQLKNTK